VVGQLTAGEEVEVNERPSLDDLGRQVREIVAGALQRSVDEVPLSAKLESGLGIDSMAMIEINMALEERFRFAMPDMASPAEANLTTVEDLVKLVSAELAKAESRRKMS
jgi:acyl carrier protein